MPTAIVGGLSTVMAVYIIIKLAYLRVASASELALVTSPATLVATRLFGDIGGKTLNGYLLTEPRIPYTLSK